ncbi:MAG TPA: Yip1 family protein [Gaiellaceae bacterium]|nr:Yip1 family protein [Gaiellaceae bacterium]
MATEPTARVDSTASMERDWWLRALAVVQSPRAVFAALRTDSPGEAEARQEPVLALVLLAGLAGVLLAPSTGRLLDQDLVDGSLAVVAVLVFLTGGIYGTTTYWLGGAALYFGLKGAGSRGSYRRARHVLAFAATPLVLGLVLVWPLRFAIYGSDTFRSGGSDSGAGVAVFDGILGLFGAWAVGLLAYGISVVERWTILRAVVSVALMLLAITIVTLPFLIPLASR